MQIIFNFSINKYQTNNFLVAETYTTVCCTQFLSTQLFEHGDFTR